MEISGKLEIESGIHQGAEHIFEDNEVLVIGSDLNSNVILQDPGIIASHCLLFMKNNKLVIRALNDTFSIRGKSFSQGNEKLIKAGEKFSLGETKIRFNLENQYENTQNPASPKAHIRSKLKGQVWTIISAITLLLVSTGIVHSGWNQQVNGNQTAAPTGPTPEQIEWQAGERMAKNVAEVLRLSGFQATSRYLGNGEVEISGHFGNAISLSQSINSRAITEIDGLSRIIAQNYDQQPETPLPELQVSTVVTGEDPYVVTEDGTHHYIGAELSNGYTITSIDEQILTITSRAGEAKSLPIVDLIQHQ